MSPNAFELPSVGSTFADQFEVLELIGQGGMGVVYRANQRKLQREVALKVLRPSAIAGGYEQFRFEREAVSAARFRSHYVVDIYDWGVSAEGLTYLVMELLHGETLAQRLDRQRWVEPSQVAAWLSQGSEALDEAAALGIVHRDIKPANLFLATTPTPDTTEIKILDFGITKIFDPTRAPFRDESTTKSSLRMGTTRYMSPEQLRATSSVDARADIWSLGVVIYQALSGSYPFDRASEADLIVAILSDEPIPLHLVNRKLSPAVSSVVAGALEKRADARYQSATEFSRALTAALALDQTRLHADLPDSTRDAPLDAAQLAAAGVATDAGLETRASNDSLSVERKRPGRRAPNLWAIGGIAFAASSAVAVAATVFFPEGAAGQNRLMLTATPLPQGNDEQRQKLSAHLGGAPSVSASGSGSVNSMTPMPSPKLASSEFPRSPRTRPAMPARSAASPVSTARSAPSAPSAQQFERLNPYAN